MHKMPFSLHHYPKTMAVKRFSVYLWQCNMAAVYLGPSEVLLMSGPVCPGWLHSREVSQIYTRFKYKYIHTFRFTYHLTATLNCAANMKRDGITKQHDIYLIITLRLWQNGRHIANDIFNCISLNENVCIFIKILLKVVSQDPFDN